MIIHVFEFFLAKHFITYNCYKIGLQNILKAVLFTKFSMCSYIIFVVTNYVRNIDYYNCIIFLYSQQSENDMFVTGLWLLNTIRLLLWMQLCQHIRVWVPAWGSSELFSWQNLGALYSCQGFESRLVHFFTLLATRLVINSKFHAIETIKYVINRSMLFSR